MALTWYQSTSRLSSGQKTTPDVNKRHSHPICIFCALATHVWSDAKVKRGQPGHLQQAILDLQQTILEARRQLQRTLVIAGRNQKVQRILRTFVSYGRPILTATRQMECESGGIAQ